MMRAPVLFVTAMLVLLGAMLGLQLYRQYHDEIAAGRAAASAPSTSSCSISPKP
jgi:hypothetical protein